MSIVFSGIWIPNNLKTPKSVLPHPVPKRCERLGPNDGQAPPTGAEWLAHPECCCGCRARLEVAKNQEHQRYFKPGHDSALKSLLRKINRGEVKSDEIPQAARANVARIKFIQADPEFQKAFAKPSQPPRRQRKAGSGQAVKSEGQANSQ
jgi:hypothetical protein